MNIGDEVSMCHFKEVDFWLKNIFGDIGGPKMILILVQHGSKLIPKLSQMVPNRAPPPKKKRRKTNGVSKRLLPGSKIN